MVRKKRKRKPGPKPEIAQPTQPTVGTDTQLCHMPMTQMLLGAPSAPKSARPKSYVVQHSERNSTRVNIGGCVLPLMEVGRMNLGTFQYLQREMATNAQVPVSMEALVTSTCVAKRAKAYSGILMWIEGIDECTRAYQKMSHDESAFQECARIQRDGIQYANEICHYRQGIDRTDIMDMLYQRMKNYATMIAIEIFELKLRNPCNKMCHEEASDSENETQRDECFKVLGKMKRLLADNMTSMQSRMLGESTEAF